MTPPTNPVHDAPDGAVSELSPAVFTNRRRRLVAKAHGRGLDATIVYGNLFAAGAIRYLTGFQPRRDSYLCVGPDFPHVLYVQFFNHVPNTREVAAVPAVEWGGPSQVVTVAQHLRARPRPLRKVGLIGPIPYQDHQRLATELAGIELVDLGPEFWNGRLVKDTAEIEWTRRGAGLTDDALGHLVETIAHGVTERELGAAVTSYSAARGGHLGICFLLITSMQGEGRYVPAQHWSDRAIRPGDMVVVELSAGYAGHTGQVLRTISIGEPFRRIIELHEVAEAAFRAISSLVQPGVRSSELLAAAKLIDDAGLTVCDDVVHGYGGGYLQPVLRTPATQHGPYRDIELEPGMMVVVQPNVVAADHSVGVQTGELLLVTEDGHDSLHRFPRGIVAI
jgi:Xaa-Pro aminopeptidase